MKSHPSKWGTKATYHIKYVNEYQHAIIIPTCSFAKIASIQIIGSEIPSECIHPVLADPASAVDPSHVDPT